MGSIYSIRSRRIAGLVGVSLGVIAVVSAGAPVQAQDSKVAQTADSRPVTPDQASKGVASSEIVVTGIRAAERAALMTKKSAIQVEEVLSANDAGKLPDQNIAEATRRLPGISVANDQGEGRYVVIRGIAPDLANVTINGQTAPAPEPDGRQVKLDDIPSAMIGSLKVIKSLTPDLDANAIAGQVDIITVSAFDRSRPFANVRLGYGYAHQNGKNAKEADVTLGTRFGPDDQFGIVIAGNYSRRPIESQTVLASTDGAGPAYQEVNGHWVPQYLDIRDYNLIRTRKGLVGNLDWRPSDGIKLNFRAMYSAYSDAEIRDRLKINFPAPAADGTSAAYINQTDTTGTITGTRAQRFVRNRAEDDHTLTLSTGGEADIGRTHLVVQGTYAQAVKVDPRRNEITYQTGSTAVSADYDLDGYVFGVNASPTAYDPTKYTASSYKFNHRRAVEDLYQLRADYTIPVGWGDDSSFKIGAKYLDRHKTNNQDGSTYKTSSKTATLDQVSTESLDSIYDGRYPFGPLVNYNSSVDFFNSNPGIFTLDSATSLSDALSQDYDVHEKIIAGYAMMVFRTGNWTIIPGVRIENTKGRYAAKTVTSTSTFDQPMNSFSSKSYTNVFPGLNVKYDFSKDLLARAAVTTAIGRPDYSQLVPTIEVDVPTNSVVMGNPNLKPLKAVNLDGSLEYYLGNKGVLAIAGFYKHIKNPIFDQGLVQSGTFGGIALTNASVGVPLNAARADVLGLELNAQIQLTFLPGFLNGFGIGGNVTLVSSKVHGLPNRTDTVPMFNQSKVVATAQIYYEKYGFSARLAYSYRSKYLANVGETSFYDGYVANHGQLDGRVSYQLIKQATVFVEGSNLNNAPFRQFLGTPGRPIENERYGWSIRSGLQLDF